MYKRQIVSSVRRVSDIIAEITASSAEQSDNIGQISQSVTQLDQMTQQNAALVEESTAASESLREQAHHLNSGQPVQAAGWRIALGHVQHPRCRSTRRRPGGAPTCVADPVISGVFG